MSAERVSHRAGLTVAIAVLSMVLASGVPVGTAGAQNGWSANLPPSAGARATTVATITIGGSVTFESFASDPEGQISNYAWYFGDGTGASGPAMSTVSHTYTRGGHYWVLLEVTDDLGVVGSNADSLIDVNVLYFQPDFTGSISENTPPFAFLSSDADKVYKDAYVKFNMTGSYGFEWDSSGFWDYYWTYIDSMIMDFGDGSPSVPVTPQQFMEVSHNYSSAGHFAAMLEVGQTINGTHTWTQVMRTVHVVNNSDTLVTQTKNPDTFIMISIWNPEYIDPAVGWETSGMEVTDTVYERLLGYDGGSASNLVPVLATVVPSLANGLISPDGLNYTFNLKTGVIFHDGTVMTADDVIYSMQRVLRIHDPSGPAWMLEQVLTDYISFYIGDSVGTYLDSSYNVSWIRAILAPLGWNHILTEDDVRNVAEIAVLKVNDTAVRFRLTHPYAGFLPVLAFNIGSIMSKDYVDAHGGVVGGQQNTWMNRHACGTGPFRLVTWEVNSHIEMERFDGYHGAAPPLKHVFIENIEDVNCRILMLQSGDADSAYIPSRYESKFSPRPDCRIVKGLPAFSMIFAAFNFDLDSFTANSVYGGINMTDDFFQDVHMRRAFSHLVNYAQYIQNAYAGNAEQPNGVIPRGMPGYDSLLQKQEYNLTAAEAELRMAINPHSGMTWWDQGFTIPLFYNAGNLARQTFCEMIRAALESLGGAPKSATTFALDWPTYLNYMFHPYSPMGLYALGWGADYADPDDYATAMLDSDYGVYPLFTSYRNDSINSLVRDAAAELDPTQRAALYHTMSVLVYYDVPYIWLAQTGSFHIERSWVTGYLFNPMLSGLNYWSLDKSPINTQPRAYFSVTPDSGEVFTVFAFNASGSSDLQDQTSSLEVRWDWEGDGIWETSWTTNKEALHTFSASGTYMVVLEVRDSGGLANTTSADVEVTEPIPEFGSILLPALALAATVLVIRRKAVKKA